MWSLSLDLGCGFWNNHTGMTITAFITTYFKAVARLCDSRRRASSWTNKSLRSPRKGRQEAYAGQPLHKPHQCVWKVFCSRFPHTKMAWPIGSREGKSGALWLRQWGIFLMAPVIGWQDLMAWNSGEQGCAAVARREHATMTTEIRGINGFKGTSKCSCVISILS